jgi:hypothetical protein
MHLLSGSLALFGGLRAPELIVIFTILVVLLGGRAVAAGGATRNEDLKLTRKEIHILIFVGAVLAIGIGMLVSQELTR